MEAQRPSPCVIDQAIKPRLGIIAHSSVCPVYLHICLSPHLFLPRSLYTSLFVSPPSCLRAVCDFLCLPVFPSARGNASKGRTDFFTGSVRVRVPILRFSSDSAPRGSNRFEPVTFNYPFFHYQKSSFYLCIATIYISFRILINSSKKTG